MATCTYLIHGQHGTLEGVRRCSATATRGNYCAEHDPVRRAHKMRYNRERARDIRSGRHQIKRRAQSVLAPPGELIHSVHLHQLRED